MLGRFGAGRTLFSAIDDSWRWRYYTGESGGYVHGLKLAFSPASYERLKFTYPNPTVAQVGGKTAAQIAASGDFFQNSFIPCDDPLLTAEEKGIICSPANLAALTPPGGPTPTGVNMYIGRRNVEGGGRALAVRSDNTRLVLGVKGL